MNKFEGGFDPEKEFINPWDKDHQQNTKEGELGPELAENHKSMEGMISELEAVSRFEHVKEEDKEIIRSPESGEFLVRRVDNPNDPMVEKIHQMMVDEFGVEEADPLYWLKESIKQGINNYDIVTTPDGELVSFSNTRYLEIEPTQGEQARESFLYIAYILTDDRFRGKGIATEIYKKFYSGTLKQAKQEGHVVKGVLGEAVETVEPFLNKMGRKRVYFEDQAGNIQEVPYKFPPMDYDSKTGEPLDEGGFEHLMLRLVGDKQEFDSAELLKMVKALYEEEYGASEEDYKNKAAYEKAMGKIMDVYTELEAVLSQAKDGKVFLMSVEERKKKVKELNREGRELKELELGEEDME